MALTKETVIDKIEIIENGSLQVRQVVRIIEDGNVISSSFHRYVVSPNQEVNQEVKDYMNARFGIENFSFSQAIIDAYEASIQG